MKHFIPKAETRWKRSVRRRKQSDKVSGQETKVDNPKIDSHEWWLIGGIYRVPPCISQSTPPRLLQNISTTWNTTIYRGVRDKCHL